jgi:hypothetical protein
MDTEGQNQWHNINRASIGRGEPFQLIKMQQNQSIFWSDEASERHML